MSLINELVKDKIRTELRAIVDTLLLENIKYTNEELYEIVFHRKNAGFQLFCNEYNETFKSSKDNSRKCIQLWNELESYKRIEYNKRAYNRV